MADATKKTLESFEGDDYVLIRNVPIFDEHDEFDEAGRVVRKFTKDYLEEVVAATNSRGKSTGDWVCFGPGHTLADVKDPKTGLIVRKIPEQEQPEPWGVFRNLKVGTFGPSKKTGILADMVVRKERRKDAMTYPRRSIELWPEEKIIDWVALLRRAPQRDLGLLASFSRDRSAVSRYECQTKFGGDMPLEDLVKKTGDVPPPGPPGGMDISAIEAIVRKIVAEMMASGPPPGAAPAGGSLPPEPEKFAVGAGMPAVGNVRIPTDSTTDRYERLEQALAFERQERAKLAVQFQRTACERIADQLEAQGYQFSRDRLVERMIPMDDAGRQKEVDDIAKYSRRSVSKGGFFDISTDPSMLGRPLPAEQKPITKERKNAAIDYATKNKCSFDEALTKV